MPNPREFLWTFLVLSVGAFYITDYGDGVAAGNYVCRTDGQTFSLRLKENHTFHQVRLRNGVAVEADGTLSPLSARIF